MAASTAALGTGELRHERVTLSSFLRNDCRVRQILRIARDSLDDAAAMFSHSGSKDGVVPIVVSTKRLPGWRFSESLEVAHDRAHLLGLELGRQRPHNHHQCTFHARTGSSNPFSAMTPRSVKSKDLPATAEWTTSDTRMPPSSASLSSRLAMTTDGPVQVAVLLYRLAGVDADAEADWDVGVGERGLGCLAGRRWLLPPPRLGTANSAMKCVPDRLDDAATVLGDGGFENGVVGRA